MKFHWRGASHQDTQPQEQDDRQEAHLRSRRWQTVAALVLTLLLFIALPVYAWFYHRRSMESVAMVNMPVALQIGEGTRNPISYLDLSKIDVEGSEHYKDVVFCVFGREPLSPTTSSWRIPPTLSLLTRYTRQRKKPLEQGKNKYLTAVERSSHILLLKKASCQVAI